MTIAYFLVFGLLNHQSGPLTDRQTEYTTDDKPYTFHLIMEKFHQRIKPNYDTCLYTTDNYRETVYNFISDKILFTAQLTVLKNRCSLSPIMNNREIYFENGSYYRKEGSFGHASQMICDFGGNSYVNMSAERIEEIYFQQQFNSKISNIKRPLLCSRLSMETKFIDTTYEVSDTFFKKTNCFFLKKKITGRYTTSNSDIPNDELSNINSWIDGHESYEATYVIDKTNFALLQICITIRINGKNEKDKFFIQTINEYARLGTKYYQSNFYGMIPRYYGNCEGYIKNKGYYTIISTESTVLTQEAYIKTNLQTKLPQLPFEEFCEKTTLTVDQQAELIAKITAPIFRDLLTY